MPAQISEFGLGVAVAKVIEHVGEGIGRSVLGQLIAGLLGDAVGGGGGELLLDLLELFGSHAAIGPGEDEAGVAGVGLHGILGAGQLFARVAELAAQPIAHPLGGLPAGFEILLDELVIEGVGEIGGDLGAGGIDGDLDDAGAGGGAHLQASGGAEELRAIGGNVLGRRDLQPGAPAGDGPDGLQLLLSGFITGIELGDDAGEELFVLDDFDLGLHLGGIFRIVRVAHGAGLPQVHEVFVEVEDLERGAGAIHGRLDCSRRNA